MTKYKTYMTEFKIAIWMQVMFVLSCVVMTVHSLVIGHQLLGYIMLGAGSWTVLWLIFSPRLPWLVRKILSGIFLLLLVTACVSQLILGEGMYVSLMAVMLWSVLLVIGLPSRATWLVLILWVAFIHLLSINLEWLAGRNFEDHIWYPFLFANAAICCMVIMLQHRCEYYRAAAMHLDQQVVAKQSADELTGLPNRQEMESRLGECMNRKLMSGHTFCVLLADIDNLKQLNENHGRQLGDRVLREVAACLQKGLRGDDVVGRWAGGEFLAVLSELDASSGKRVAERLRQAIMALKIVEMGEQVSLTVSFGLASPEDEETVDEVVSAAERGLYQAKQMGKNLVIMGC